ncbi:MAG: hypothetical protein A2857_05105 [Candidatus Levybacteria bacterium RIFCSPHIGHO2_01_FULL_36_15]|nr:MAG: hypothetical protein A2857_05105 [Candidatus Levybacteria bacterium RIFCSPHIGHO2_01_FULL_36_15]OGH37224.1 MAG: hypothetical protein A2905_05975 [Candidatus Levybacteria bacterium RIFCSPLOWO2_01_FULL_36_10]
MQVEVFRKIFSKKPEPPMCKNYRSGYCLFEKPSNGSRGEIPSSSPIVPPSLVWTHDNNLGSKHFCSAFPKRTSTAEHQKSECSGYVEPQAEPETFPKGNQIPERRYALQIDKLQTTKG